MGRQKINKISKWKTWYKRVLNAVEKNKAGRKVRIWGLQFKISWPKKALLKEWSTNKGLRGKEGAQYTVSWDKTRVDRKAHASPKCKYAWQIWRISIEGNIQSKCGVDGRKVQEEVRAMSLETSPVRARIQLWLQSRKEPQEAVSRGVRWSHFFFFLNRISLLEGVKDKKGENCL